MVGKPRNGRRADGVLAEARFITEVARTRSEIRAAQRLRYRVYRGASDAAAAPLAIDEDRFDAFCEHLIVRDRETDTIVGTYRLLTAAQAERAHGFYSATEFDLTRICTLGPSLVEVGRACVHPAYRSGAVVALLLAGVARWVVGNRYEYVIGCASVGADAGLATAAAVCARVTRDHLAPDRWRVTPRLPLAAVAPRLPQASGVDPAPDAPLPPLLKAYLRLGAYACGEPAWDPDFRTADLFLLLPVAEMRERYRSRLLRGAA